MVLEFPDAGFDAGICSHVCGHAPSAGRRMTEIRRVPASGGCLGFAAGKRLRTIGLRRHLPLPSSVMPRALLEKPAG